MDGLQPSIIKLTVQVHSRNLEGQKDIAPEILKFDTL